MGHPHPVLITCLSLITACLEPPELESIEAPTADLGAVLTWGPLDEPLPSTGPDESGPDEGGPPVGDSELAEGEPPDPALAQLQLTEVLADPEGRDGGAKAPEFVELLNPGPASVALDGLVIEAASWPRLDAGALGLVGVSLEPGALLLVQRFADDVDPELAGLEVTASLITIGLLDSGGLRNGDGHVRILAGAAAIDELVYGAPSDEPDAGWSGAPIDAPGSGTALCRDVAAGDHDSAADWSNCTPNPGVLAAGPEQPGAEPKPEPKPIAAGALQIVEVLANPLGPASGEKSLEVIEVLNLSAVELELSGCRVGDDVASDAPGVDPLVWLSGDGGCVSPTCLAPGRRAIIVGQGYVGPTGPGLVLAVDDSTLADGGLTNTEPVVIWDALDNLISSYRMWSDPSGEPLPADGVALHRLDPAGPDEASNWITGEPSPGE